MDGRGEAGPPANGAPPPPLAAARPLPPRPPRHAAEGRSLQSYVSEPPSSLSVMKDYAQELLLQQQAAQAAAPAPSTGPGGERRSFSGNLSASISLAPSGLPGAATSSIELPPLSSDAQAAAFLRPQHFQLPPQLIPASPRQPGAAVGSGAAAAGPQGAGQAAGSGAAGPHPCLRTSIGWATSRSPSSAAKACVLEHRVAGDLILPVRADAGAAGGLAGGGGPHGGGHKAAGGRAGDSPCKDGLRRRPMLRASHQSAAGPSPSPRGGAAKTAAAGAGACAGKLGSPSKKAEAGKEEGDRDELDSLDFDEEHKPWYRRKKFWLIVIPLLFSLAFILAGTLYLTLAKEETLSKFEVWRICFFFAGLPIIWWIGRGSMELAVWAVEKTLFTMQNALYYAYSVRRPMANLIRAGLTTAWWAIMMTSFSSNMDGTLRKWYNNILKVLGCLTLFMTAQLLKVLFAKMMSSKFNQHSHYSKMHQALKREYLLHCMLQPRQHYAELEGLEGEDDEGEEGEEGLGGDLCHTHSAPSELDRAQRESSRLRFLSRPSFFSLRRMSAPALKDTKGTAGSSSFKDKFMFWRTTAKDLQPIDETEEEAEADGSKQDGSPGSGKPGFVAAGAAAGLPPDAVALTISPEGSAPMVAPESPLLAHSPSSSAMLPPAPAPGARPAAAVPALPLAARGSPQPVSKLVRHRSDALEAVGLLPQSHGHQTSPRQNHQQQHRPSAPNSGSQTPRRLSSERQQSLAPSLSLASGAVPAAGPSGELRGQLSPLRVPSGQAAGAYAGPGSGSRDPSVSGGKAAFGRAARISGGGAAGEIRRSASMASHRSAPHSSQPTANPPPAKRALMHSPSSTSSGRGSHKAAHALRMAKMEKYIRKHALEVTFKDALSRVERSEKVTSELEAKKLGFYCFYNVKADYNRDHIILEDLEAFLSEGDAKAAMDMLDADENGQVNVQECCAAIAQLFVDRRNLAASLKDAKTIVGKLETVIGVVLHIFMFFLYLIIFNVDVMKTWAGFASLFLGFSFVFGNSIRTTYENVVFLFIVHPYDVGDSLMLDALQYKVEEIHLSFTVLASGVNARIWYPNEKIRILPFTNLTTSGNKGESFTCLVDIGTSTEVLAQLQAAGEAVIRANPKEFNGTLSVNLKEGPGPLKLAISVYWEFSHSGADAGRTVRNRTKMLTALSDALHKAGVKYTWPATADGGHSGAVPSSISDEAAAAAAGNSGMLL